MKRIVGGTIGNCVHVAGVIHFLDIARQNGYDTIFLGTCISPKQLMKKITELKPTHVALGYRLTPGAIDSDIREIIALAKGIDSKITWCFGGTKPVADLVRKYGFFDYVSDGYDDIDDAVRFFRGTSKLKIVKNKQESLIERINESYPYPIFRHHFGQASVKDTAAGIKKIAEAGVLDIISLGPDQNAQQFFFRPNMMNHSYDGAGGVPVRTALDFVKLKQASMCGNYPLMRCYSGTNDVFQYAELLQKTISNAWAAIPLCWYNELDGRSERPLEQSIEDAIKLIHWHAMQDIPVEINEPHHWGLREAHDVIPVVMAYISALFAKKLGVRHYIAQYMFNNPGMLSFSMDLAKVLAMIEMVESIADDDFHIYRETRAGLPLFRADQDVAKGQLAASTFMQMAVKPHIMHVVGFCEADHAARAEEVIESCKIAKGVVRHTLNDDFGLAESPQVLARKNELLSEANVLLNFIRDMYSEYADPLTNADVIVDCVKKGYIDAVHIQKNQKYTGNLYTRLIDGKCLACDMNTGMPISEAERLRRLLDNKNGKAYA